MNIRRSVPLVAAVMALLLVAGQVFAQSFNLTVSPFAGTATTNNVPKVGNCTNVMLWVNQVGGNFFINAGAQTSAGRDISAAARVTTGSAISYPETNTVGQCGPGQLRRIQFRTDINTLVNVQVSGNWSPG